MKHIYVSGPAVGGYGGAFKVVNLTLVDLPGFTKVAVEGQSENIVADIENMVRNYVEKQQNAAGAPNFKGTCEEVHSCNTGKFSLNQRRMRRMIRMQVTKKFPLQIGTRTFISGGLDPMSQLMLAWSRHTKAFSSKGSCSLPSPRGRASPSETILRQHWKERERATKRYAERRPIANG